MNGAFVRVSLMRPREPLEPRSVGPDESAEGWARLREARVRIHQALARSWAELWWSQWKRAAPIPWRTSHAPRVMVGRTLKRWERADGVPVVLDEQIWEGEWASPPPPPSEVRLSFGEPPDPVDHPERYLEWMERAAVWAALVRAEAGRRGVSWHAFARGWLVGPLPRWLVELCERLDEAEREQRRSGRLLPCGWWLRSEGCSGGCGSPFCDLCRVRAVARAQRAPRAALMRLSESERLTCWMVTTTRVEWTSTPEGVARHRAARSVLGAALLAAGALSVVWVAEATVKPESSGLRCCEEGECPLCCELGGYAPKAHYHWHGLVVLRRGWRIPWGWLQRLSDPRSLDPLWGTLDVRPAKDRRATGGDVDRMWGYMAGYLKRLKSNGQAAWFRRMAPGARLIEHQGVLRGKAAVVGGVVDEGHQLRVCRDITVRRFEAPPPPPRSDFERWGGELVRAGTGSVRLKRELYALRPRMVGAQSAPQLSYRRQVQQLAERMGVVVPARSGWAGDVLWLCVFWWWGAVKAGRVSPRGALLTLPRRKEEAE